MVLRLRLELGLGGLVGMVRVWVRSRGIKVLNKMEVQRYVCVWWWGHL